MTLPDRLPIADIFFQLPAVRFRSGDQGDVRYRGRNLRIDKRAGASERFGMKHPVEIALRIEATLGEGALWDGATQRLLWVDITQKRVGRFDPVSGANESFQLPSMVGTVVTTTRGDLLVALQDGVARLDPRTGLVSGLRCPAGHDPRTIRFNDGKCDPQGRLWAGTMALDFSTGAGALYCFAPDGTVSQRVAAVTVSNGIVWSHDQRRMYYIDSPTRGVDVFDYDPETGVVANRRRAWSLPEGFGFPDGMTIDAEGKLWIALWGGSAVVRWDPVAERLMEKVDLPAAHITSCAFGGPDLKSLYITSAREGRSPEQLAQEPLAGSIFVVRPGVAGVEAFAYRG